MTWIALVIVCFIIYKWATWNYDYWKKNGIPYVVPTIFFGNLKEWILLKKNSGEVYSEFYWKFPNEAAVGLFNLREPQLLLRDLDLIKTVCVKEFKCFEDNIISLDLTIDPIFGLHPIVAKGDLWKNIRNLHSKAPTSKKMKELFPLILESSMNLIQFIESSEGEVLKTKYLSQNYMYDALISCVFGLRINSFLNINAGIKKQIDEVFKKKSLYNAAYVLFSLVPELNQLLRRKVVNNELKENIIKLVKSAIDNYKRNIKDTNFIQTLLDEHSKFETPQYSLEEMAGHSMTLFGSIDNTSTLMDFVIYFLAQYPDIQTKVRDEIKEISNIDYENIQQMKYLDAVIDETLRLYTSGQVLKRSCTKDIILKSGNRSYPIYKGMTVAIPVYAIHRDPTYFTNPLEFNPDRFYNKISSYFLPFGMGPRACLSSKFGLTLVKSGIVNIMKDFKIIATNYNEELPALNNQSLFITPKKELEVIFMKDKL